MWPTTWSSRWHENKIVRGDVCLGRHDAALYTKLAVFPVCES